MKRSMFPTGWRQRGCVREFDKPSASSPLVPARGETVKADAFFMAPSYVNALAERARRCTAAETMLAEIVLPALAPREKPATRKLAARVVRAFLRMPQPARDAAIKP